MVSSYGGLISALTFARWLRKHLASLPDLLRLRTGIKWFLLVLVILLPVGVIYFRVVLLEESIVIFVNRFLADDRFSISAMQELNPGFFHSSIAELEIDIPSNGMQDTGGQESSLQLQLAGVRLNYAVLPFFNASIKELHISELRISQVRTEQTIEVSSPALSPQNYIAQINDALLAVETLPFEVISIEQLWIPQWHGALQASSEFNPETGEGQALLRLPEQVFNTTDQSLASGFTAWPYDFDLVAGSVEATLALQWQSEPETAVITPRTDSARQITALLTASLQDIGAYYEKVFVKGLQGSFIATLDSDAPFFVSISETTLTVESLDVGFPVENLVVNYQIDAPQESLLISSLSAEVLGGTLQGSDLTYDFAADSNQLDLSFSHVQLSRVLGITGYEGIETTGAISGVLPLLIRDKQISLADGSLFAEQPGGHIRYLNADALASGDNQALDMVSEALSNYEYDLLESDFSYRDDGELLFAMRLQGQNPDVENGRRINLNINVSNNVLDLLRSLQTTRAITDFLEAEYK